MKLTARERDFLTRVRDGRTLALADRDEDRARQKVRRAGLVECLSGPRRWQITDKGRSALAEIEVAE